MDGGLKSKLTGWSATVGLAALSLLGNAGGVGATENSSTQAMPQNEITSGTNTATSAAVPADKGTFEVAQSRSPPPPPPPAVGAVRG
jgi:hypothetical protein